MYPEAGEMCRASFPPVSKMQVEGEVAEEKNENTTVVSIEKMNG